MSSRQIDLSVVIPVYKSGPMLGTLQERLTPVLDAIAHEWEVIMVDDGSMDGTYEAMQELRRRDKRFKLIQFVRNHGQQLALLCGLRHASGNRVVTMDDDLQNPPEEIPRLLAKLDEGYEISIGRIKGWKRHSPLRNFASRVVQRLGEHIMHKPRGLALSSFRALSFTAARSIASHRSAHPYFPVLMFRAVPVNLIGNVDVRHDARLQGKSTYTVRTLVKLASYLLINHSTLPLRFVTLWGIVLSAGALMFALFVLIRAAIVGSPAMGWPSLAILVSFFSGNILLALGVIGEYVGRLLEETSRGAQFFIARKEL